MSAHEAAVDLDHGIAATLELDFAGIRPTVFQHDGSFRNVKRSAVNLNLAFLADNVQHGRRNDTCVAFALNGGDGLLDRPIVGSVDSERLEHRH